MLSVELGVAVDLVARQLAELQERYREARLDSSPDGQRVLVVPDVPTGPGWSRSTVTVRVIVPAGYPHVDLDCFYIDGDVRLGSGTEPSNSSLQLVFDLQLRWFSWHVGGWDPNTGSLDRYIRFCEARLRDAR